MNNGGQSPDSGSKGQSLTSSSKGAYYSKALFALYCMLYYLLQYDTVWYFISSFFSIVYSPHGSPQSATLDLSDSRLPSSCAGLPPPLTSSCQAGSIRAADYPPTTATTYTHPADLFAASSSLTPYTQSPSIPHYDNMMFTSSGSDAASGTGYPAAYGTTSSDDAQHGNMDPIPIIPLDQTTGNPIQFYSDCTTADLSPRQPYDPITPPCSTFSSGLTFPNVKSVTDNPPVKGIYIDK